MKSFSKSTWQFQTLNLCGSGSRSQDTSKPQDYTLAISAVNPLHQTKGHSRTLQSQWENSFASDRIILINNNHNNIVFCILSRGT